MNRIKSFLYAISALLAYLVNWVYRVGWLAIKAAIFVAITWGALSELTEPGLPVIWPMVIWIKAAAPTFLGAGFLKWVAKNWMSFTLLVIFFNSVLSHWLLRDLEKTSRYTRTFSGTVMNYFAVGTETPSMKRTQEVGAWMVLKESINEKFWTLVSGIEAADDGLNAIAVRHGETVYLADDMKKAINTRSEI